MTITLIPSDTSGASSLAINMVLAAPGHAGHTPVTPAWWLNTGTAETPQWTMYLWGSALSAPSGTAPNFHIKFSEIITDSEGHQFKADRAILENVNLLNGPVAEPAHSGMPPTRFYIFTPQGEGAVTVYYARAGPEADVFRRKAIKGPDAQLIAMQNEDGVVLTDLLRTGDIEQLDGDGFTITSSPGFHMGHIGFNIRPDQTYKNKSNPDAGQVLGDVHFRHALFHMYNQEAIVSSIYGYIATPVQSLVPLAQGGWVNPEIPLHPYNPGDKTATTEWNPETGENEDACSILRYANYTYNAGTNAWAQPNGDPIPDLELWTPPYEVAPTSAEHGAQFIAELNANGLRTFTHQPRNFSPYMGDVDDGDFDMYMVFWSLGRFPDHLYKMCSYQGCPCHGCDYNFPGIREPEMDEAVFTIISSLDHEEKLAAAYKAQNILYNTSYPKAAFSYMQLYSMTYFNAFNPDLLGIVNSPGYGADNSWTYLNLHWAPGAERTTPGGETLIEWITGYEPELLNPTSASTEYAWDIIGLTQDGLMAVDPYTHEDIPWLATDWTIEEWPEATGPGTKSWMNLTYTLREDVFWQDGTPFTASDVLFNWDFLRDNQIPRYEDSWQFYQYGEVSGNTVKAVINTPSQFLLYDFAGTAALLPPNVWARLDGKPLVEIMQYDPSTDTNATGMGPWFGSGPGFPANRLFGTGPFVFESYNPALLVTDFHQSTSYFLNTREIRDMKVEMFHLVGDVTRDGIIDVFDLSMLGAAFNQFYDPPGPSPPPNPLYDEDADLNSDGVCDGRDLALITFHWSKQRSYPEPDTYSQKG